MAPDFHSECNSLLKVRYCTGGGIHAHPCPISARYTGQRQIATVIRVQPSEKAVCIHVTFLFSLSFVFFKVGVAFPTLSTCHCLSVTPHLHDGGTIFCNSGWSKGNLLFVSTEIAATRTVQTRFALILKVLRVKYMLYWQDEWCCALTAV